jgi:hypothetical protein
MFVIKYVSAACLSIHYPSTIQRSILRYELFNKLLNIPRMQKQVNLLRRHDGNVEPEAATCEPFKFDAYHYYVGSFLSHFLVTIIILSSLLHFSTAGHSSAFLFLLILLTKRAIQNPTLAAVTSELKPKIMC